MRTYTAILNRSVALLQTSIEARQVKPGKRMEAYWNPAGRVACAATLSLAVVGCVWPVVATRRVTNSQWTSNEWWL